MAFECVYYVRVAGSNSYSYQFLPYRSYKCEKCNNNTPALIITDFSSSWSTVRPCLGQFSIVFQPRLSPSLPLHLLWIIFFTSLGSIVSVQHALYVLTIAIIIVFLQLVATTTSVFPPNNNQSLVRSSFPQLCAARSCTTAHHTLPLSYRCIVQIIG